MIRTSVVSTFGASAAFLLLGCATGDAPPGLAGPTLSLTGAQGISAELRRTVTEVTPGAESVVSAVDTSLWAAFDGKGAAVPSPDAGLPGPVGWLTTAVDGGTPFTRYRSFVDSAGVLHEIWVEGRGRGALERMAYHRDGRLVAEYGGHWTTVTGGLVLAHGAVTYHLVDAPAVRVEIAPRNVSVAQATPFDRLLAAGTGFTGLLGPRPLAAQFYFRECTKEWLGWGGAALLAEIAWGRFVKTKSPKDFKMALAATTAAGVALDKLVDCMMDQGEQPDPA